MDLNKMNHFLDEMEQAGRTSEHFTFASRNAVLTVMLAVEKREVNLLFGVTGFDPKVGEDISRLFLYLLKRPCCSQYIMKEDYDLLVRLLATPWSERVAAASDKLKPEPFNLFSLIDKHVPDHIPAKAFNGSVRDVFSEKMIGNAVQDPSKKYFCGFRENYGCRHVSAQNLAKTQLFGGSKAKRLCDKYNMSTCWTSDPKRVRDISKCLNSICSLWGIKNL